MTNALSLILFLILAAAAGIIFSVAVAGYSIWFVLSQVGSFVGFLLQNWVPQTLLAAWVAFQLQEMSASNSRRRDRLQSAYDRKVDATKRLYALIEKRIYASRRYLATIEQEPTKISAERDEYRAVVAEWNSTVKLSQVDILLDFDGYVGLTLDRVYYPFFAQIDALLRTQRLAVERGEAHSSKISARIASLLRELNREGLDLTREMLKQARRDRNIMDEKVPISEANLEHLSYRRLFKALLQSNA